MPETFSAQVRNWTRMAKARQTAIFKTSAQEVFSRAQTPQASVKQTGGSFEVGKIPVDDGDLRGSFISGLNGGSVLKGPDSYVATIAQASVGDTIVGGWTAEHALPIEFGTDKIAPRAYMRTNAAKWQEIVSAAVKQSQGIK